MGVGEVDLFRVEWLQRADGDRPLLVVEAPLDIGASIEDLEDIGATLLAIDHDLACGDRDDAVGYTRVFAGKPFGECGFGDGALGEVAAWEETDRVDPLELAVEIVPEGGHGGSPLEHH